jgi:hypothetical protein
MQARPAALAPIRPARPPSRRSRADGVGMIYGRIPARGIELLGRFKADYLPGRARQGFGQFEDRTGLDFQAQPRLWGFFRCLAGVSDLCRAEPRTDVSLRADRDPECPGSLEDTGRANRSATPIASSHTPQGRASCLACQPLGHNGGVAGPGGGHRRLISLPSKTSL